MEKKNNISLIKIASLGTMVSSSYLMHLEQLAKLEDEINKVCKFGNQITCDYDLANGIIATLHTFDDDEINVELSLLIDFLKKHNKISFNEFVELSKIKD